MNKKTYAVLCPTRSRAERAFNMAASVFATAADFDRIEILFYVDDDDPE